MKSLTSAAYKILTVFIVVMLALTLVTPAYAATLGPNNAGTGTNVNGPGTIAWTNFGSITADDASYATANLTAGTTSEYIQGTNYGFTIPLAATITGIQVSIMRQSSSNTLGASINDVDLNLLKAGVIVGTDHAVATDWPTAMAAANYGGVADLWGTTWTPAEINAGNFGVALSGINQSATTNRTASVDYIQITVSYNLPATTTTLTSTLNPSNQGDNVTFTATVAPVAATGTVNFFDGATNIGSGVLVGGVATLTTNVLIAGNHSITAQYLGDTNYATSISTPALVQVVFGPPVITSANNRTFVVGTNGPAFTVTANGNPAPTFSIAEPLPGGLAFNGTTGVLTGTPTAGTAGVYTLTITATNSAGTDTQVFTLTINQAPAITSGNATTFTVGAAGSFTVTSTGRPSGPTLTLTRGGALPTGVTFVDNGNGTGTLSGTPAAGTGGTYNLTFTAANGVLPNAIQNPFTLTVNEAPVVTSANNITFTLGQNNTFTPAATGFPVPTWAIGGVALPGGVNFNAGTHVLSGAPAAGTVGAYAITFTVTNASGTNTQNFTLNVIKGNQDITFAQPPAASYGGTYTINPVSYNRATPPQPTGLLITVTTSGACTNVGNVISYNAVGTCTINTDQPGNASYNAATRVTRTVAVTPATTNTTITSSVNPSVLGQNVIFTVRVYSGGVPVTGGTITLSYCYRLPLFGCVNAVVTVGTQALIGGVTTFNVDDMPVLRGGGYIVPHSVTATYNPTANYATSFIRLEQTVNTANTAVTLTSSINPSYYLQPVTFTATVTVQAPGAGVVQGGTVTFYEGATTLCSGTVNASGEVTCTLSNLARGTHPITAHFVGTDDFGTSTSPVLNQIVRRDSDTALVSSLNPSVYGDTVTFTATVTEPAPGGGPTPITGTVSFQDVTDPLNPITLGTTNLNGIPAVATFNTSLLSAGSHNITATYNGNNFYVASTSAVVVQVVNPKVLTVTADDKSTIYGDANVTFTYTFSGFVNSQTLATSDVIGTADCATTATNASPVGTYPITCTIGSLTSNNYTFAFAPGTLTITPKALTITAINQGKTYGITLTLTGTEFYALGLINNDGVDTVTLTSPEAANPVAPAGDYPIVPSAAVGTGLTNYTITYVNGNLHVGGNILVITADDRTKTYGQTLNLGNTGFTAVGLQGSDTVTSVTLSSLGVSANATVGTYAIAPSAAVGTGLGNYFIIYQPGTLDVNQALLTFDPDSHTKLYGDTFTGYTGTFTGLMPFDVSVVTPAYDSPGAPPTATVTVPGPVYPIAVTFIDPNNRLNNYILTLDPAPAATLTVQPRALTVTPTDRGKSYGDLLTSADYTGTITGIQNGDDITATYDSLTGDPANAPIGTYPIASILSSNPVGILGNYAVSQPNGTLTVGQRSLVVTSDSQSKIYGDTFLDTSFTGSVVGLIPGDVVTPTYASAGAVATAPVGVYNITVLPLIDNGGVLGNYSVTYDIGTLAVTRRDLVFTPNNRTKLYGDTIIFTSADGVVTGLQNGDAITPNYSSPGAIATATVAGSPYPITVTLSDPTGKLSNYNYTLSTGTLTVTPRPLIVDPDDKSKIYGQWFLAFTGTITGIQNNENITANYASAGSPPAANVGTYPIPATLNDPTGKLANYAVTLNTGTLTVTGSVLTVRADNKTIFYGDPDPAFTFLYSGFMGTDTPAVIDNAPTCTVSGAHTNVGTYPIVCSGGVDNNYTFSYVSGTLTVIKRTLEVTPADKIKLYGSVFSAFTGTISGVQAGDTITATYTSLGAPADATIAAPGPDYPIVATLNDPGGKLANYNVVLNTGTLTVVQRTLVVSPDNQTKIYGDTFTAYTATINGLQNGETVIVNYTSAGAVATATVAGSPYPITITLSDPGNILSNYDVTLNSALLTVTRRPLIVTPDNKAKVFGVDFTAFTGTVVGLQAGDNITETYASPGAPAAAVAGTYPITVTLTDPGNKLPNYLVTLNTGTLTVGVNVLTVTANNQTMIYGDPDPAFTFTYAGFQGTDDPSVIDTPPTCVVAVAHNAVGGYPITCSGGADNNYIFTYNPGTLTVTPRVLTVTPDSKTKVYGDTFTAFTGTVVGLQAGDNITVNYSSTGAPATATVALSPYPIVATLVDPGNRLPNYTVNISTAATLTVTTRTLVVTPDNKNKVYGSAFNAFTGTVVGLQGGDSVTVNYASAGSPATADIGTYPIIATLVDSGGILSNYAVTLNTGTLTVTVRDLVVTPADKTKIYGDTFTAYTGAIVGIQNGDAITATYFSTGAINTATVAGSPYDITATLNAPVGVLNNYNITYNMGTLTVTERLLIVTPDDKGKAFGANFTAFTGTVVGLQAGDIITPVYASTGAGPAAAVGTYPITVTLTDLGNRLPNYIVTLRTGTLTVGNTVLTITANNQSIVYGSADPLFTFTYAGFQPGDTPAVLTTLPTCQVSVTHDSVGGYPITCSGGVDENYVFSYTPGTLTVTARTLVVTPANKTKVYGDTFTAFTGTVTGALGADSITVTYDSNGAPAAALVGPYPINATLTDPFNRLGNYIVTLNTGTLTVTRRTLIATPDDKNKVYGTVFTAFTGTIAGLQNGDNITATYASTGAPAVMAVGPYPITVTLNDPGLQLPNYLVTLNTGTLIVTGNVLIVTPADKVKTYGDLFAAFTGTVVGVQPGDGITATYSSAGAAANAIVGAYDITVTLNDPLGRLPNYSNVILNIGTLTVNPRALVVTPDNKAKVFGTLFNAFTGTVTGVQAGDNITATYASTGAPIPAAVGSYAITAALNDPGTRLSNYIVTLNTGTLTVGNTILTVTADNQTKVYGDVDPLFTFTYAGFSPGDTSAVLTTEPTCQVLSAHNAVGIFPITCSGGIDENYSFSYVAGTLTVTARPLTVTPDAKTKIYGDVFTAFTGTVTGLQASDNITVTYSSTGAPAPATVAGSPYPIIVTLTDPNTRLGNYTVVLNTANLVVTQRPLVATSDDKNKAYGVVFNAFTGSVVGIQNGDAITATYTSGGSIATAAIGNYPILINLNALPAVLANYTVTYNIGTLSVGQYTLVVTPDNKTKVYGDVFSAFTGAIVGLQPGDNITATYASTGALANATIGNYPITVTLNDPDGKLVNYAVTLNTGTLVVTPRALTVTPDNKAKVFGTVFSAFTGAVTGIQAGDNITVVYDSTGAPAIAAVGTYNITATLTDPLNRLSNYTVTLNTGTLTVGNTVLTVTANNQTKVYGDPDPAFTFTYAGFINGDTAAVLTTEPTCQVTVAHNAMGTFPISCSGGVDDNYIFSYVPATLTVTSRTVVVTPDAKTKVYGDLFTAFTGTVTGLQASDNITVTYSSTGAPAIANVATYPIIATLNDPNNRLGNYTVTLNTANLVVTQRPLVATPDDKNKVYGTLFTAFTGTISGIQNGDNITPIYASTGAPVAAASGTYPITVTLNDPNNRLPNYAVTLNTGTLTVGGNTLIVTAADKTKVYGNTFAAFTGTIVGLQPGDVITATYASAGAAANAVVGDHNITVTLNDPGNKLPNYTVIINTGTLTVTPRALIVTPDNKAKVFGTVFNAFTGTVTGVQAGDNITPVYASTGAPAVAAVGTYPITVTLNDPGNRLSNYTVTLNTGTLTVGNTVLTVTANNQTIVYGTPDPVFTFNYAGFVGGDTPASIDTPPTCQVLPAHNAVGTFPITCAGGVDNSYVFTYVAGTLTVTPRPLAVTPDDKSKVYGDIFTAFTGVINGIQGSDNITATYASIGAPGVSVVGTYPITVAVINDPGNRLGNYTVTRNTGTLSVTQRALTVTSADKIKFYGNLFTAFTGTITGIQNGDNITSTYASAGGPVTAIVGDYPITITMNDPGGRLPNYAVTTNPGTLTVSPRDLVVTPADKTKSFGSAFNAFTGTVIGIKNGDGITATYSSTGSPANAPIGNHDIAATLVDPANKLPNYDVALNTGTLTVAVNAQTITITIPAPPTAGFNTSFTVSATASSGLPVVYSAGGTACTNVGATFTMTANTGICIVQYDQPGDANYPPANQLTQTVSTQKASQTITVTTSAPITAPNGTTFPVAATSSSGLPVNIVSNGNCSGNGSDSATINMSTGTGICTIIYSQVGDSNYLAATSVTEIVSATNAPVITLQPVDAWVMPGATATFTTAGTGNPSPTVQWQVSTDGGATFTNIPGATATTFSLIAQLTDNGDQYRAVFTNTEGTATTTPAVLHVDNISPRVTKINSVADTGDARLDELEIADVAITQLLVTFTEDLSNPIGNIGKDDVTNPANYILVRDNGDGIQTTTCSAGVQGGDVDVAVDLASFNNRGGTGPFIANLYINGGAALRNGIYRLVVCGTTSIADLAGNKLAGDGATGGTDFTRNFSVNVPSDNGGGTNNNNNNTTQTSGGLLIPVTGFKHGEATVLPKQPADKAYAATDLWLEIPKLKLKMPIMGVPQTKSGWDISWLGRNAGWLNGSAFPTWKGNSVITAHVWDELNKPGPFVGLLNLQYGDQVIVHAFGYVYTYEVAGSSLIAPTNTSAAFKHEDKSVLTLITCEDYKEATQTYKSRRMVRAVLVSVTKEK